LAKRYDEIQWVARIIFDAEGRVRSRSIRAVSTPVTLTWSQAPDEVLWDFANSGSLFLRCTGTGLQNEYQSWPTWFYVASAQLPPGWQVEAFPTNGVLQCGPGSKEFSGIGNSRVIVQAIPFATFYRFTYVVQVPSNAQPGSYILRWTVFDRHQGKLVTEETTVVVNA